MRESDLKVEVKKSEGLSITDLEFMVFRKYSNRKQKRTQAEIEQEALELYQIQQECKQKN